MPRFVIFDTMEPGSHTWYEDAETGATVNVYPGSAIAARKMLDPEQYVARGLARIEGEEDGSDGLLTHLTVSLRKAFADVAPLSGPPKTWTLTAMLNKARDVEAADIAARKAFEASEQPMTVEDIKAADAAAI
jgi:hypothetical protein